MKIKMKAVVYSCENVGLQEKINQKQMNVFGYDCSVICGAVDELLKYLDENIVNVLIIEESGFNSERFSKLLDIIHNNYCKNILVISSVEHKKHSKYYYVNKEDEENFDLDLAKSLLEIKNKIMELPSHSIQKVKSAVHDILLSLKFSPKNSGFTYFVDAITITFFNYPLHINVMDMYAQIGKTYGRKLCAVEKAMRTTLSIAVKEVRRLNDTNENKWIKEFVKHDLTNSLLINMVVGKLLTDNDFGAELYSRV